MNFGSRTGCFFTIPDFELLAFPASSGCRSMRDWAVWNSSRGVCGMSCLWDETRKQGNLKEIEPQQTVGLPSEAGALPTEEPGVADGVQHARKKLSVSLRDSFCRPNMTPQSYFDSQRS